MLGAQGASHVLVEQFGNAEIEQFDVAFGSDQHIGRFQVAMHDQRPMRRLDRTADHQEQHQALAQTQGVRAGVMRDRHAVDQLQRDVGESAVGDAALDQARDARMPQACQRFAFASELALRVGGVQAASQQFDGDFLAHPFGLAICAEHGGRATLAEYLHQRERADAAAGRQGVGDAGVADRLCGTGGIAGGQQVVAAGVGGQHAFDLRAP